MIMTRTLLGSTLLLALAAATAPVAAQTPEDGRWLPWLGCWVEVGGAADAPMLCIRGDGPDAELMSVARSGQIDRRVVRADGRERPAEVPGCTGTRSAEFSADGARVYTVETLECGDSERTTHEILAMVEPDAWVRIRSIGLQGQEAVFVTRYRAAPEPRVEAAGLESLQESVEEIGLAVETARMAASVPIGIEDILEAHDRSTVEAVSAWITEDGQSLEIDREALLRLADADVAPEIIDVAIAVSYPQHFAVANQPRDRDPYDGRGFGPPLWPGGWDGYPYPWMSPWGWSAYDRYRGGYSGYGWSNGWGGWYRPTVVVVRPTDERGGRAIKGSGYTRGSSGTARAGSVQPSSSPSVSRTGGATRGTEPVRAGSSSSTSKGKAKKKGG